MSVSSFEPWTNGHYQIREKLCFQNNNIFLHDSRMALSSYIICNGNGEQSDVHCVLFIRFVFHHELYTDIQRSVHRDFSIRFVFHHELYTDVQCSVHCDLFIRFVFLHELYTDVQCDVHCDLFPRASASHGSMELQNYQHR